MVDFPTRARDGSFLSSRGAKRPTGQAREQAWRSPRSGDTVGRLLRLQLAMTLPRDPSIEPAASQRFDITSIQSKIVTNKRPANTGPGEPMRRSNPSPVF